MHILFIFLISTFMTLIAKVRGSVSNDTVGQGLDMFGADSVDS